MIDKKFEKWATGYSGFDGGNPNGKIWLCGIEWGGKSPTCIEEIRSLFNEDVSNPPTGYEKHQDNMKYDYNKRFLSVIAAIYNIKLIKNNDLEEFNNQEKTFTEKSNYFKLNLSPFNFPTTDTNHWCDAYKQITSFDTKKCYEEWVWNKRCSLFQEMTRRYSPKLIITVGASENYFNNYKKFFGYAHCHFKTIKYESDKRLKLRYYLDEENKRLIVNIYFFTRGWLVKNEPLKETGQIIRKLLDEGHKSIKPD